MPDITLDQLFKQNNQRISFSPKQQEIFDLIIDLAHPRNQIIAPTQYGKSLTVGLAVLICAAIMGERFTILAPSEKKAQIIMSYIIEHTFDDAIFLEKLELDNKMSLDRLRRERSRTHLTFRGGGGVMVLTLDARNSKRSIEAAMGFGGNRIILDESSLIDDTLYATVKRMLGGYKYDDTFLLEIGNPFHRNHFYRTWHSNRYHKVFIDYHTGLQEGRYSQEFIDEMREEAFFDVFYECQFPPEDAVDERGYRRLVTMEDLEKSFIDSPIHEKDEELRLGVDIGGGGDSNVYVLRSTDYAWVETHNRSSDTMTNVKEIERILETYPSLQHEHIFIDDIGIGRGVSDRLQEMGINITPVTVGEKAQEDGKYKNRKAENFWQLSMWVKAGGKLAKEEKFKQLVEIKYKISTDKVLQIEPKDELKKRTGKSPDFAEALMLTFTVETPQPNIQWL
jgi:hypothetical protein